MAKQQSLAAQTGALTAPELKLPEVFQGPIEAVQGRYIAPYITFAHPKRADEWSRIAQQYGNVTETDMYLVQHDSVLHLPKAKLALVCAKQYWAEANAAGEMLRASFVEQPKPFKEHIEAVLLLYLDDRVLPVNVSFRGPRCSGAKVLSDELQRAASSRWSELSAAHKETLVCGQAFMRYYGILEVAPPRNSKQNGLLYRPTVCRTFPTSVPEWRLMQAFIAAPDTQKRLDDAAERYQLRLHEVKLKAGK